MGATAAILAGEGSGGAADVAMEASGEVALIGEAGRQRDLGQGEAVSRMSDWARRMRQRSTKLIAVTPVLRLKSRCEMKEAADVDECR